MNALQLIETVREIKQGYLPERESLQVLSRALNRFALENKDCILEMAACPPGGYFSHLLNSLEDDFRVALIFWGARAVTHIHDHGQAAGVVAPIFGTLHEAKYQILQSENSRAVLKRMTTRRLRQPDFTSILDTDNGQVHVMMNTTHSMAGTIHVYLSPVEKYHIYRPQPDGAFLLEERSVRIEQDNEWQMLEECQAMEIL